MASVYSLQFEYEMDAACNGWNHQQHIQWHIFCCYFIKSIPNNNLSIQKRVVRFRKIKLSATRSSFCHFSRKLGTFSSFPNTVKKWQKLIISIKTENVCEKCQEMMIRLVKSESSMSNSMVILTKRKSSVDHWLKIEGFPQTWSNNTGWINFNHHQYIK